MLWPVQALRVPILILHPPSLVEIASPFALVLYTRDSPSNKAQSSMIARRFRCIGESLSCTGDAPGVERVFNVLRRDLGNGDTAADVMHRGNMATPLALTISGKLGWQVRRAGLPTCPGAESMWGTSPSGWCDRFRRYIEAQRTPVLMDATHTSNVSAPARFMPCLLSAPSASWQQSPLDMCS